jgi:flagellar motor switch protein FliN/FliY
MKIDEQLEKAMSFSVRTAAPNTDQLSFTSLEGAADPPVVAEEGAAAGEHAAGTGRLDLVLDVPVRVTIELGRTEMPIRDIVNLGRGSTIELDRAPDAPLEVRVNGVLIGRGEIVVINEERLGLRFLEVVTPAERLKRLE